MLKYKNFLRKKTTKIYLLIYSILLLLISLILSYRYNLFKEYDNNYKDTYFIIQSDKIVDEYLIKDKNIININRQEINEDMYKYEYIFYLRHYYDFTNKLSVTIKEIKNHNIKMKIDTKFEQESYLDIGNQLEYTMIFIYVITFVTFIVIILTLSNIITDEKKTNLLYKYLGFSPKLIIIVTIVKVLVVIFIPTLISLLSYYILTKI